MRIARLSEQGMAIYLLYMLFAITILSMYRNMAVDLIESWNNQEEYSHGYFLPVMAIYFLWQKRALLQINPGLATSWSGVSISLIALLLYMAGAIGFVAYLEKISFLILIYGIFVSRYGFNVTPIVSVPLFLVFLSYPLPFFINAQLTSGMQLLSSQLGVFVIRLVDIPVFLEGNIIDIGVYKLQVVEACSGLRYMFPLISLALILVYLFQVAMWKRVIVFVSAIPITILMNSIRIGIIGVLVEFKGTRVAEGFLHDFQGWMVFMICLLILFLEMWLLTSQERKTTRFMDLIRPLRKLNNT